MLIRAADPLTDAEACAAIYGPYVSDSVASFEEQPPTPEEMRERMHGAYIWLVALAEADGPVVGYAYASQHRSRAAYRWAADVAVYIDAAHHRAGVGSALYAQMIKQLRAGGFWKLCAGITEPNEASTGLHLAFGFRPVGTYERIGWKAGAWHDVTWLALDLRPGEPGDPTEPRIQT